MQHAITAAELEELTLVSSTSIQAILTTLTQTGYVIVKLNCPPMERKLTPEELEEVFAHFNAAPWQLTHHHPVPSAGIPKPNSDKVPPTPDYIL